MISFVEIGKSRTFLQRSQLSHDQPAPHTAPAEKVLGQYHVNPVWGLSEDEARATLEQDGPNELEPPKRPSRLKILLRQILNAMAIVLLGAMAVSFGTQDWIAAGVIGLLVFLNVYVGYTRACSALLVSTQRI